MRGNRKGSVDQRDLPGEKWADIPEYDMYEVSDHGRIRRKAWILSPGAIPSGHLTVNLCNRKEKGGDGKQRSTYVHRLVATAFIPNTSGKPLINHRNGDPKDNRVENLEWSTYSENIAHGYRSNGRRSPKECRVMAVDDNGEVVMSCRSMTDAAKLMGRTPHAIQCAVNRRGKCAGYYWVKYG